MAVRVFIAKDSLRNMESKAEDTSILQFAAVRVLASCACACAREIGALSNYDAVTCCCNCLQVTCVLTLLTLFEVTDNHRVTRNTPYTVKMKKYTNPRPVCKSFCVREYFKCFKKNACHKKRNNQFLRRCKENLRECTARCLGDYRIMDFKKWQDRYRWIF